MVEPSGAAPATHGDILHCRCSGTRLTEACRRNSSTRSFSLGKEALTSHGQRIASESPVGFFEQTFTDARFVFVQVANENFAAHGWFPRGCTIAWDPPLIHNCSADVMAHGSRIYSRNSGTRLQILLQKLQELRHTVVLYGDSIREEAEQ